MDYELIIRPEARTDLLDTFQWYQEQRSGLGFDFKLCVDEVFSKLQKHPSIYKKAYQNIRRAVTRRFPFSVFYIIENNKGVVLLLRQKINSLEVVIKRIAFKNAIIQALNLAYV